MPGSTAKGWPYVLPADNVADYPVTSQALATKADTAVHAMAAGSTGFGNVAAGGSTGNAVITYPVGVFAVTPSVALAVVAPTPKCWACVIASSAASCTIQAFNSDTVIRAISVTVIAMSTT